MSWRNYVSIFIVVVVIVFALLRITGFEKRLFLDPKDYFLMTGLVVLGAFLYYFAIKKL